MFNRRTILTLAALAAVPAGVQAQSASARTSTNASVQTRTSTSAQAQTNASAQTNAQAQSPQARIDAAMQAAAEAQIPQALLESKVSEAEAKQATPEQTAAAVESRLSALIEARGTLANAGVTSFTAGDLLVTAEALNAGVSEEAIAEVASSASVESRATATATLTDLVRLGTSAVDASAQVGAALAAGADALVNLQANAASQLTARGLAPTSAAINAAAGVTGIIRLP